jgi:probable F420-dependent oxidoreductase
VTGGQSLPAVGALRPFRFGVVAGAATADEWKSLVQRAESLNYSTVFQSDHLDVSGAHVSTMAPMVALASAAAMTTRIHLGTSVLNQDLRHPAVLAREAATLQRLSNGRAELGIGAGWAEQEYRWAGIPFHDAPTRLARLAEYLDVVKGLLQPGVVEIRGPSFTISNMPGMITPGLPPPRIMVGGARNGILRLAAQKADIVNIGMVNRSYASWPKMDEKISLVRGSESNPGQVELSTMVVLANVACGERLTAFEARLQTQADAGHPVPTGGLTSRQLLRSPAILAGSVQQIVEELAERRRRWGLAYHVISHQDMEAFAPVVEQMCGL